MPHRRLGEPGFCLVTDIDRPQRAHVEALARFSVALIGDGLGRRAIMDAGIKPLAPTMRLAGPAVTVEVHAGDNLMIHAALKLASAGDVLVINGRGDLSHGIWGGLVTTMALRLGLAGVVVDGAVRDSDELVASGFPVFSRGINPTGGTKDGLGQVNMPISCGGVPVMPGDVVIGDADGIVVVPAPEAAAASERAAQREAAEARRIEAIRAGPIDTIYPAWLMPTLRAKGILSDDDGL